jgi:serine/threonine protein kinase
MDNYEPGKQIGQGQFSRVYAAIHKSSRTRVALKLVPKPPADTSEHPDFASIAALKEEVKCHRSLRHENILRLLACFETDRDVVFVSELCSADLLQMLKKEGKFPELRVQVIARQLVSGLCYLHERQIIHRDLKLQVPLVKP